LTKVAKILKEAEETKFYPELLIKYENGKDVLIKMTQSIKP